MGSQDPASDLRVTPRLVIGLAVMLLGLVLALDSLGLLDGSAVLRYWPLVLIAVGILKWFSPPCVRSSAFIWIVAGASLLLVTLGRMPISRFWAVLLFFAGANIAWRAVRPSLRAGGDPMAHVDTMAILGGSKTVSHAADFRGGQAVAAIGGCELDLRHASIPEGGQAVIDTFAFWGGIEIKVPEEWEVVTHGAAFLGGFENNTHPTAAATRRLVVTGTAIMGGVEVKN